jgi:hypothetical protein
MTFKEFWPLYVLEHSKLSTRIVHVIGTLSAYVVIVAVFFTANQSLLLLLPLVSYGPAWLSHFFIEGNRPTTFKYPFYSLIADHKMVICIFFGTMKKEIALAKKSLGGSN